MRFRSFLRFTVLVALCLTVPMGGNDLNSAPARVYSLSTNENLVGITRRHVIQKRETLLDIARMYDLGFNEIRDLYPDWDPWLPPAGVTVDVPSQWILPDTLTSGILVNTAELRLYYFDKEDGTVSTFPVGIGEPAWPTPEGMFRITARIFNPAWSVPPSLQGKYGARTIPPGPDNPLGAYWLGLGTSSYGIHGTDFPWAIGRTVTRGCIRMYPEDICRLFPIAGVGTLVKIVYKPVKIGQRSGKVFLEVHRDVYGKIGDLARYARLLLFEKGVADRVDPEKLRQALDRQSGMPVDVTMDGVSPGIAAFLPRPGGASVPPVP